MCKSVRFAYLCQANLLHHSIFSLKFALYLWNSVYELIKFDKTFWHCFLTNENLSSENYLKNKFGNLAANIWQIFDKSLKQICFEADFVFQAELTFRIKSQNSIHFVGFGGFVVSTIIKVTWINRKLFDFFKSIQLWN